MINTIPQAAIEQLKSYVYRMIDPRTNEIFYIGKGEGNRVLNHVNGILNSSKSGRFSEKQDQIIEIKAAGLEVHYDIIRHGLTQDEAFLIESVLIDFIGQKHLRNEIRGNDSRETGLMTLQEVINKYAATQIKPEHRCLLININRQYVDGMNDDDIYQATKQSWIIGKKREEVEVVLATYKGIVRGAYMVKKWYPVKKRWGFDCANTNTDLKSLYLNKSVEHLINKGNQNPIKYLF